MFGTGIEGSLGVDHSIKEPPPQHTHTHHPFHYVQGPHAGTAFTPCDCSACVGTWLLDSATTVASRVEKRVCAKMSPVDFGVWDGKTTDLGVS